MLQTLAPFIVSLITQGVKKTRLLNVKNRKPLIRLVVALFSLLASVGTFAITEGKVPVGEIQIFAQTLINFIVSTGIYHIGKK